MAQFTLDLFFSSIFVLLLILMIKMRERAFADNKESFRYAFLGMSALTLASFLQLAVHQEFLNPIPFLSEPIYQELAQIIAIMAGVTLLISGISIWLPSRKKKDNNQPGRHSQSAPLVNFVELVRGAQAANELFPRVISFLCHNLGYDSALVLRHLRNGTLILSDISRYEEVGKLGSVGTEISVPEAGDVPEFLFGLFNNTHLMTLQVRGKAVAYVLLYGTAASSGSAFTLDDLGAILSARLEEYYLLEKNWYQRRLHAMFQEAQSLLRQRTDMKSLLPSLHSLFHRATGAEYFSLSIVEKHFRNRRRYIAGINGGILLNGATTPNMEEELEASILESGQTLMIADISHNRSAVDSLFLSCGQKCFMGIPVFGGGKIPAVLILGHPRPGQFGRKDLYAAEFLASILASVVEGEISRRLVSERDCNLAALAAFAEKAGEFFDIESLLTAALETMLQNIPTTMIRISVLSSDRSRLETRSLKTIRPFNNIKMDPVSLTPELVPWHQMVINENRLLLINQLDSQSHMSSGESDAMLFTGVQSALLVPIQISGLVYGVMTLGEMRHWDRFSYDSAAISFCKGMASILGQAAKTILMCRTLLAPDAINVRPTGGEAGGALRRGLKTPLSSLQGSLELLKATGLSDTENSNRMLSIMEESTEQILSVLERD